MKRKIALRVLLQRAENATNIPESVICNAMMVIHYRFDVLLYNTTAAAPNIHVRSYYERQAKLLFKKSIDDDMYFNVLLQCSSDGINEICVPWERVCDGECDCFFLVENCRDESEAMCRRKRLRTGSCCLYTCMFMFVYF